MPPDTEPQKTEEVDTTNFAPVSDHLLKLLQFLTANPETTIRAFSTKDKNWLSLGVHNGQIELITTLPNGTTIAKVLNPRDQSIVFDARIFDTKNQPREPKTNKVTDKQRPDVNLRAILAGMAEDVRVRAGLVDMEISKPAIASRAKSIAQSLKDPTRKTKVERPNQKTIIFKSSRIFGGKTLLYNDLQKLIRETGIQFDTEGTIPAENLARFTMESILREAETALPKYAGTISEFLEEVTSTRETFFKVAVLLTTDESANEWIIKFEIK